MDPEMTLEPRAINTYIFHSAETRESRIPEFTYCTSWNVPTLFVREASLRSNHRESEYLNLKNRDSHDEFEYEIKCILLFALVFVPKIALKRSPR